jgi:hypothetical protein
MQAIAGDVRRYAWTRGQAFWRMAMPVPALLEDARGARDEGQLGLMRHTARNLAITIASTLALLLEDARPLPPTRAQPSWALDRIAGHPLAADCERLIRGDLSLSVDELYERCVALNAGLEELAGRAPDPMQPDGYFPALARTREWLKLAEAVDEEGFLPAEWTGAF